MATTKYWRKGAWQYSTTPKEYPTRECAVCACQVATNAYVRHLNAHAKRNEVQKQEYNEQTCYILDGTTIYVKD